MARLKKTPQMTPITMTALDWENVAMNVPSKDVAQAILRGLENQWGTRIITLTLTSHAVIAEIESAIALVRSVNPHFKGPQ